VKRWFVWFFIIVLIVGVFVGSFFIDLNTIESVPLKIFWNNLKTFSTIIFTTFPLIIITLFLILLLTKQWAIRVEKLSLGGISLLFENPEKMFERRIRNYLETKRSVFIINLEQDNFFEVFNSYYEIYKTFLSEILLIENRKRTKGSSHYHLSISAIKELNQFLTAFQSDYRRWYTYIERKEEQKFYLTPIGELQKEYSNYEKLCQGFKKVNVFFSGEFAKEFGIDVEKWNQ
jgi:hypothetical protein